MYVYELAIQIGKRSTDLTDAAAQLGLGQLIAASELNPEQASRLLAHFGHTAPAGAAPASFGGSVFEEPAGAPVPSAPRPSSSGGRLRVVVGAVAAIAVLGALCGGAYAFLGKDSEKIKERAAAEKAAEEREDAEEMAAEDAGLPNPNQATTVVTTPNQTTVPQGGEQAMCAAAQRIADMDDEADNLTSFSSSDLTQLRFAIEKLMAQVPQMQQNYADLKAAVPPEYQNDVQVVSDATVEMLQIMDTLRAPEDFVDYQARMTPVAERLRGPLFRIDELSQDRCGIVLAD